MRIRQYVSFLMFSATTTADELSGRLGLTPDYSNVLGSRVPGAHPIPRRHMWEVRCDSPGLRIDEQIATVVSRLKPHEARIAATARQLRAADPAAGVVFSIVRYFDDAEGEEEVIQHVVAGGHHLESLSGQHQLLGWHIDRDTLEFILRLDAELDADEYC